MRLALSIDMVGVGTTLNIRGLEASAESVGAQAAASGRRARDQGQLPAGHRPVRPRRPDARRRPCGVDRVAVGRLLAPSLRSHSPRQAVEAPAGRPHRPRGGSARGRRNTRTHGQLGLQLGEALPGRALAGARRAASSRAPALPRQAAPRRRRHRASRRGTGHYALLVRDRRPGTSRPFHGPRQPPSPPHSREPGRRAHRPRR